MPKSSKKSSKEKSSKSGSAKSPKKHPGVKRPKSPKKSAKKKSPAPPHCSKVRPQSDCNTVKGCTYIVGGKPPCKRNYGLKVILSQGINTLENVKDIKEAANTESKHFKGYLSHIKYKGRSTLTNKAAMISAIQRKGLWKDFDKWMESQL
jgi:hypothetical protein